MARTRAQTVVTTTTARTAIKSASRISKHRYPTNIHKTTRPVHGLTIQFDKHRRRTSRERQLERSRCARLSNAKSDGEAITNIVITRVRGSSSSGSSDPTGISGSGSSGSARISQDSTTSESQPLPIGGRSHSSQGDKNDSKRVAKSHSGPRRNSTRRKTRPKVIISDSFTEFRIPHGTRNIRVVVEDNDSISTSPITVRGQEVLDQRRRENYSSTLTKAGGVAAVAPTSHRLSPRSLRKARLRVLDKTRKRSSSSSASMKSLFANDRRGSTLLPRQHYCEHSVRGHHDAPSRQQSRNRIHTNKNNSPDPGSPHGGNGSASPEQEKRKGPHRTDFKIANMGVAEIIHAVISAIYSAELAAVSTVDRLDLDDQTRSQFQNIARRRHGITATGMGEWNRTDSCHQRLDWTSWCILRAMLGNKQVSRVSSTEDNKVSSSSLKRDTQPSQANGILVPLTNAQVELLRERLSVLGKASQK